MALDFPSVLYLDGLLDWLVYKNISEVDLLLGEVSLGAKSFSLELEGKSFLCAGDIAIGHAVVGVGLGGHESNSDGNLAVRPDVSNQRLDLEDVVLEQKEIIFNCFSDCLVFPR